MSSLETLAFVAFVILGIGAIIYGAQAWRTRDAVNRILGISVSVFGAILAGYSVYVLVNEWVN